MGEETGGSKIIIKGYFEFINTFFSIFLKKKYEYSYEEAGILMQQFVPAWRIKIENYFSLVLFNYLFSNGDAHLKNFSLSETTKGDYTLSPAYDLVNTRLHVDDSDFALSKELFADKYQSKKYKKSGHAHQDDFFELGKRIGIATKRVEKLLKPFLNKQPKVEVLLNHSFLNNASKKAYFLMYQTKRNYLEA